MRYWQDFQPGERFTTSSLSVTQDDILEFAAEIDPQPYHLDSSAARESIFGGLCASGWQVTAMMMRLITDVLQQQQAATLGSSGVKQLRWKVPVFAGDTLSASLAIAGHNPSDQPGLGEMDCSIEMRNQNDITVLEATITLLLQLQDGAGLVQGAGRG